MTSPLAALQRPDSVRLDLKTLTPLHTGGIGQQGEQLQPAGILGSLRAFSTLVAAALGDADFAQRVWGNASDTNDHHAKRVALQMGSDGLNESSVGQITFTSDNHKHRGWYYGSMLTGDWSLTLTRRNLTDSDWNLLKLALRIQLRHATLGARDQWGLGVMQAQSLPAAQPLTAANRIGPPLDQPGLHRAIFAKIQYAKPNPVGLEPRLKAGLIWRAHLRNQFRGAGETQLRHTLMGDLRTGGTALNLSGLYATGTRCELRLWGVIPHTVPAQLSSHQQQQVVQRLRQTLTQNGADISEILIGLPETTFESGREQANNLIAWLNQLAGV